ncbi:hypothetical protein D9611_001193 [Ephemerocybe angulata]|uniref:F-box domain-containing protein n=1 Tax=Ephemerocybe angulata TaxID=980116 RepID=A0A8H5CIY6_9AGAR|nr:hypothetical protein D9611_001193 [Tulosesus angulatus]
MRTLPSELQTLVIKCLRASDIVHSQQTCKDFNNLIEGSTEIWKACLKNQCHDEGLFWSTYNGLSTALEYKNACIGVWRFKEFFQNGDDMDDRAKARYLPVKAYGDLAEEGDVEAYEAEGPVHLDEPQPPKNPHPGITGTYLIPGGRFLIAVDKTWLLLWDLGLPGKVDAPVVLSSYELCCPSLSVTMLHVCIVDNHSALRIVLQEYPFSKIPPYIPATQGPGPPLDPSHLHAFHRFEICLPESGEYTIKSLGRLCVASFYEIVCAAQTEHQVALNLSSNSVVLWNTAQGDEAFSFWESPVEFSTLYIQQDYLFTIAPRTGVQAILMSQFPRTPIKNGFVDLRSLAPNQPSTIYTFNHPKVPGSPGCVMLPRSIPSAGVVKYDVEISMLDRNETHRICQFSFDFHFEEPTTSTLRSLGTPHYRSRQDVPTCKDLNNLIEGSTEIWKACLKNQCHNEGLFWSTYNGLSTALEYKNACIGIWRFKEFCKNGDDMYDRAKARYLPVKAYGDLAEEGDAEDYEAEETYLPLYLDRPHTKNPHPGISSTYLVPGGRFLITVDGTWLLLWDLGLPGKLDEPVVLSSHKFHCSSSVTMLDVYIVDEHNALRIVLQEHHFDEIPPYISANHGRLGDLPLGDSRLSAFHRFEISLPESGEYTIKLLGRLCVARKATGDVSAAQIENQVALELSPGNILLWNTLQPDEAFSFWENPECSTFYMQQGYLFTITGKGVHAINLSQFSWRPVKHGFVDLQPLSPEQPSITHTFTHPTSLPGKASYVMLPRSIRSTGVVKYDMMDKASSHRIWEFSFDFYPEETSESTLRSLGPPRYRSSRPTWPVHRFECAEGGWGYVWEDLPNSADVTITLHEPEASGVAEPCQDLEADFKYPENEDTLLEDVKVCPFSGRAVFMWDRTLLEDTMLEIVDYL